MGALSLVVPVFAPLALGTAGYTAWRVWWRGLLQEFLKGPGRTSRILLLLFIVFNWKSLPLAWTYRVFKAITYHSLLRKSPCLGPKALFKPLIVRTHAPLLEIDYNLHKSNSTYFADLDVARVNLVVYLCRQSLTNMTNNGKTKLVLDPQTNKPIKGSLAVILGAVHCSFKKEIAPYQGFEMWTRVLSWDRKWLHLVTHYMPKNAVRPTEWLDSGFRKTRMRGSHDPAGGWERKILATAVSKYVFKLGRFTVHPAIVLGDAGLLPERPGGWMSGEQQLGDTTVDVSDIDLDVEGEWDWRRVEAQRRKGMEMAAQFQALEGLHETFDGGSHGALASFAC